MGAWRKGRPIHERPAFFFRRGSVPLAHFAGANHLDHARDLLGLLDHRLISLPLAVWFWFLPEPPAHLTTDDQNHSPIPFLPVLLILLAFVLYTGAEVGFSSWIYTYAVTLNLRRPSLPRI